VLQDFASNYDINGAARKWKGQGVAAHGDHAVLLG
jgi:hypothetical protein